MLIVTTETIDGKPHITKGLTRVVGSTNQMTNSLLALKEQALSFGANAIVGLKMAFFENKVVFLGTAVLIEE